MNFLRNNWYRLGLILFIILSFFLIFFREIAGLDYIQIILIGSFMALLIHQYEEYAFPGGAPVVLNRVLYGETKIYNRYPGNKQSSLIVNMLGWLVYIIPIFFKDAIWLGLASMFYRFFQFLGHGLAMNIKGKSLYNPGLLAVVFLHIPIGLYYIIYVHKHNLVNTSDYVLGFITLIVFVITTITPVKIMQDKNSRYSFTEEEMSRFNILEKLEKKGVK